MKNKFYSVGEVAAVLNIHEQTVYKYVRTGELPSLKVGRSWFIPRDFFDVKAPKKEAVKA